MRKEQEYNILFGMHHQTKALYYPIRNVKANTVMGNDSRTPNSHHAINEEDGYLVKKQR